jgi:phosphoribosylpyrophosphate synthetase
MNENGGVHLILPSYKRLKLFTGLAHPELAFEIASHLGVGVSAMRVDRFRDGKIRNRKGTRICRQDRC